MSLHCEISGEPLLGMNNDGNSSTMNEIVVTPSGHLCIKRLLLTKLSENGGLDPFESTAERELPLSEDQLVTLQTPGGDGGGGGGGKNEDGADSGSGSVTIFPPRSSVTSLPNLLGMFQKEYDALVLELFDTRKVLEETRRELSQALYQNDAAIRVVARISQERDAAKQQLEQWNASANASADGFKIDGASNFNNGGNENEGYKKEENKAEREAQNKSGPGPAPAPAPAQSPTQNGEEDDKEPTAKRRRLDGAGGETLTGTNDIPEEVVQAMQDVWTNLSRERKPMLKVAAAEAVNSDILAKYDDVEKKSWHKSTNKGIPCMAASDGNNSIVTAGKDKQLVVYNVSEQIVEHTFGFGCVASSVHIGNSMVVAGNSRGKVAVFSLNKEDDDSTKNGNVGEINLGSKIVDVRVHPTDQHIISATADGRVTIASWNANEKQLKQVASLETNTNTDNKEHTKEQYTAAALHPDGLLYAVGTNTGRVLVWDFKNKTLALTLTIPLEENDEGVSAIAISNNGYTMAVGFDSGTVRFWNLIKQKVIGTYKDEELGSINAVVFDKSGKYAAIGGKGGIQVTTVKKWEKTVALKTKKPVSAIVWSKSALGASFDNERAVHFYGVPPQEKMEE